MLENQGYDPNLMSQQFIEGTPVYDLSGDKIGDVSEHGVQHGALVVHKGLFFPKDIYVPMSAIRGSDANGVYLNIAKDEIKNKNWDSPPAETEMMGATTAQATTPVTPVEPVAPTTPTTPVQPVAPVNTAATTGTTTGATTAGNVPPTPTRDGDIAVPVREEELLATKEREERGRVHVHRDVVEEQQTVSAPVTQEEVRVERNPVDAASPVGPDAFTEKDIDVPVMGERLNVEKQARVAEEVHLHKDRVTEREQASDTVRRERVNIEGVDEVQDDQGRPLNP